MSILLESLTQSDKKQQEELEKNIPNVDDSHFDDEMFNDDDLLKQIKFWKIISFGVMAILLASWAWFYISDFTNIKTSLRTIMPLEFIAKPENESKQIDTKIQLKPENQATTYQPKKIITKTEPAFNNEFKKNRVIVPAKISENNQPKTLAKMASSEIIEFESLSDKMLSEIPELEISSYAVSSNAKKSFVVLNGSFYAEGEVISPNMTLVKITQENIIVNYKDQLIRKKYKL